LVNRDSSGGIAMSYGLDGQGSIAGRGKIFLFSITSSLVSSGYRDMFPQV
jgi:hypothetical protein